MIEQGRCFQYSLGLPRISLDANRWMKFPTQPKEG